MFIKRHRDKIYLGLFVVIFSIATMGLVFSLSDINTNFLCFSSDKLGSIIGVFVSTVALVVTTYFVVLAISAYSHIRDIQQNRKKIDELISDWINKNEQAIKLLRNYAETLYEEIDEEIALEELKNNDVSDKIKRRNSLRIRRARLSYRCPMLDYKDRIKLLNELASIGELKDIRPIKELIVNEDGDIKAAAELVLEDLQKKLGLIS